MPRPAVLRVIWYQHRTVLLGLAAAFATVAVILITAGLLAVATLVLDVVVP